MVRQEGPSVYGDGPGLGQGRETTDEVGPVPVIPEERAPLEPTHHDMMEDTGCIETWTARHGGTIA